MTAPAIALPNWYARFSPGTTGGIGPFTIVRPDEGCGIASFGNAADPGVVLFDGYLFDRAALKREYGLAADATDAAIASAAYQRWGVDVFDRIDGSYLLAVWDPGANRLLLGHDPLGHHPVFYAEGADGLWFTSNVLALPAAGAVPSRANRVSMALAVLLAWPAAGETFFEHVKRVRPGHYLSVSGQGQVHESHYWSPWLDDDDPGLSEKDAREQFEPMLVDAIGRCMELAPQGIMLSGGLDSVTIAALAAEYSKAHGTPPIRAVSGRRDYPPSDEEAMQTAVAGALHMQHLVAKESEWQGQRSVIDLSLDAVGQLPGPSRIYWAGSYMEFYRFVAARGVSVALTGSGGDNWVSVVDAYAAHAMRHLDIPALVQHMRSWTGTGGMSFRNAAHHLLWSGGARLLLDSYTARWVPGLKARYHQRRAEATLPAWLCPDAELKDALADTRYRQRPAALTPQGRIPRNFYRHAQRSTVNPYFQYEFEVGFHVESTCGLRLLSPYHDRTVVRFLNSIPPHVLLSGQSYKGMLRPLAESRLPNLGLAAQRKTYSDELRVAQYQELRDGVLAAWPHQRLDRLGALGIIDPAATRVAFESSAEHGLTSLASMYALMSAERWMAAHGPA